MYDSGTIAIYCVVGIIYGVIFGFVCRNISENKGRSPDEGFWIGFILGIIGLVIVALLPANEKSISESKIAEGTYKKCPYCAETIMAEATVCRFCGRELLEGQSYTRIKDFTEKEVVSSKRYVHIQELVFDSYVLDCPVEIEKGALLLDTESKEVLLQLWLNILDVNYSEISSITIGIAAFDDAGDEIPEIKPFTYTFRDVYLLGTKSFGDKDTYSFRPKSTEGLRLEL